MNRELAIQRDPHWANVQDAALALRAGVDDPLADSPTDLDDIFAGHDGEDDDHVGEPLHLVPSDRRGAAVRTASLLRQAHEVGTWSLEYLGPGFHVQLRIVRRNRQARLDGWMSPARPVTVLLASLLRKPVILETRVGSSGRFEFPVAPTGACRMSFVIDEGGRPPATPPFWV